MPTFAGALAAFALALAAHGAVAQTTLDFADAGPQLSGPSNRNPANVVGDLRRYEITPDGNPGLEERWLDGKGFVKPEHYEYLVSTRAIDRFFEFRLTQSASIRRYSSGDGFLAPATVEGSSASRSVVTRWYLNGFELAATATTMDGRQEFVLRLPTDKWRFNAFRYDGVEGRPRQVATNTNWVATIRDIANARPVIEIPNGQPYATACSKIGSLNLISIPNEFLPFAQSGSDGLAIGAANACASSFLPGQGTGGCWFPGLPNFLSAACNNQQLTGYVRDFFDTRIENVSVTHNVYPAFVGNHGLDGGADTWRALFDKLRERGYVAFEKHLYGNPSRLEGGRQTIGLMNEVLREAGRHRVVGIGHSFGGVTWSQAVSMLGADSPVVIVLNYATPLQGSTLAALIKAYREGIEVDGTDYRMARFGAAVVFARLKWSRNRDTVESLQPAKLVPWYQSLLLPSRNRFGDATTYINISADYWTENKSLRSTRRPGENAFPPAQLMQKLPSATRSAYNLLWDVGGVDVVETPCEVAVFDDLVNRTTFPSTCRRAYLLDNKNSNKGSDLVVPSWSSAPRGGPFRVYGIFGREHFTAHELDDPNGNAEPGSDALTVFDGIMGAFYNVNGR